MNAEREWDRTWRMAQLGQTRLHYACVGDGPAVILLHGNPGFLQDFSATLFDRLSSSFRLCAVDRPGHGASTRPQQLDASVFGQARLVRDLSLSLELDKPILVAHSWSGALALAMAVLYPEDVSGVVLLGAMTHPVPMPRKIRDSLLAAPFLRVPFSWLAWPYLRATKAMEGNLQMAYASDEPIPGHLAAAKKIWSRPARLRAMAADNLSVQDALRVLAPAYPALQTPVTVIYGDDDPFLDPVEQVEKFAAAVPGADVVRLVNTGHEIAHVHPEVVVDALNRLRRDG